MVSTIRNDFTDGKNYGTTHIRRLKGGWTRKMAQHDDTSRRRDNPQGTNKPANPKHARACPNLRQD
ncbi:hypothetical protein CHS0354_019829 [Potamilus streckersoni]|uniref:Uncharacterized protein n=1 Tax=Potamilus streckersoni TaxID=2493646 RepID=A0AAE0T249_9BIVA|nr:hypothetical protein CHS0354_019829 [Potamilus streckersoni]